MSASVSTTPGSRLRWRALLLNVVFNLFMFESLSGFLLFFTRGFLSAPELLGSPSEASGFDLFHLTNLH